MSYGPPQGNPNYYGGAPPSHSPQPGYGPAPSQYNQGPYPPQTHSPFPPQQGGFGPPHQSGFQQHGGGNPPQQAFGAPPPPQGQFPPMQQSHGGPPAAVPSLGYDPRASASGDASRDAESLRAAMKGFGTDETTLINILSKPDPLQMALLRNTYSQRLGRNLEKDVASETSSSFKEGLTALVRGPLGTDVHNVHKAIKGLGTKESVLNDVLLGRSNADMRAIKQAYHETYHHSIEADVKGDLSMKTAQLFEMVLHADRAEESSPIIPQELDRDVSEMHRATDARIGKDQIAVCRIISSRSDGQIRAIASQFQQRYDISLDRIIEREFTGHMRDALLLMIRRAMDRAMTDAVQLEDTMKGVGTKDDLLVNRVVRCHWDRDHMDQVKRAYQYRYKRDLISRVRGEVRGDVERLLVACLS